MNFHELVSLSLLTVRHGFTLASSCIHFRAEIVECQRLTPREFGHFFSQRGGFVLLYVGVQCNTVQSLCIFICAILGVSAIHKIVWMRAQD